MERRTFLMLAAGALLTGCGKPKDEKEEAKKEAEAKKEEGEKAVDEAKKEGLKALEDAKKKAP